MYNKLYNSKDVSTLLFASQIKDAYYTQMLKGIDEIDTIDDYKTQTFILETLNVPIIKLLEGFVKFRQFENLPRKDVNFVKQLLNSTFNIEHLDSLNSSGIDIVYEDSKNLKHSEAIRLVFKILNATTINDTYLYSLFLYLVELSYSNQLTIDKLISDIFINFDVDKYNNEPFPSLNDFYTNFETFIQTNVLSHLKFASNSNDSLTLTKTIDKHLLNISKLFFDKEIHLYKDIREYTMKRIRFNRVVAVNGFEFCDLYDKETHKKQVEILRKYELYEYQIERLNRHLSMFEINSPNYNEQQYYDESIKFIKFAFPNEYREFIKNILSTSYNSFTKAEQYKSIIKRYDLCATMNKPQHLYSMHQDKVHCTFENFKSNVNLKDDEMNFLNDYDTMLSVTRSTMIDKGREYCETVLKRVNATIKDPEFNIITYLLNTDIPMQEKMELAVILDALTSDITNTDYVDFNGISSLFDGEKDE